MSRLTELIEELCPNGVPYIELSNMAEIGTGSSDRKDATEDGRYPFYVRSKNIFRTNNYEYDETAIVIPGEGGIGDIFHYVVGKYALHQRAYRIHVIDNCLDTKYLYYYMFSKFKNFILKKAVSATVTSIRKPMIEKFPVAVPPIEIQHEIVRVLDSFTENIVELTSELRSELKVRRNQYEYYRDELFGKDYGEMLKRCFENNVKVIPLNELGSFSRGKRFVRNDIREEGIPCIHYGDLYTYYGISAEKSRYFLEQEFSEKMRFAHKGDVVIVQAGENDMDIGIGVAWIGDEDVAVHDACYIFKHNINPKYISHYLRTNIYHLQIKKYVSTGKICSISAQNIGRALIPIPTLEEQQRIVDILDRFYTLCNDISIKITGEIEGRQKQYEYYRDKLLTFKMKDE
ncbi:MAG: restriction endonuclease subunit S [Clostridium sp.]|uniref:restriction endonuclease subunit S n=1 Tax=Clostridium sp. TaxID=1506 RepID=UPI0025BB6C23|nr:restriction endonuclease subunit S [Clostridium sp.]MCF0149752.1 restriction endonuclease subunit S [Clostridium sp.]